MKNKIYLVISMLLLGIGSVQSQADSLFWNSEMIKIATPTSNADWINIKPEILLDPLTFFIYQKKALNQGPNDEMRLDKTETDNIGMTHSRYLQYFKGYKINTKSILEKAPYFILALIFGVIAIFAQKTSGATDIAVFPFPQRIIFASYGFIT